MCQLSQSRQVIQAHDDSCNEAEVNHALGLSLGHLSPELIDCDAGVEGGHVQNGGDAACCGTASARSKGLHPIRNMNVHIDPTWQNP